MSELDSEKRLIRVEKVTKKSCDDIVELNGDMKEVKSISKLMMKMLKPMFFLVIAIVVLFVLIVGIDIYMVTHR